MAEKKLNDRVRYIGKAPIEAVLMPPGAIGSVIRIYPELTPETHLVLWDGLGVDSLGDTWFNPADLEVVEELLDEPRQAILDAAEDMQGQPFVVRFPVYSIHEGVERRMLAFRFSVAFEDERGKFMDKAWAATGVKGDCPYGGVILMEIEGQAKERAAALEEAERATRMANQLHARVKELEAENLRLCTVIANDDTKVTAEASTVLLFQEALMKIARPERWLNNSEQMLSDILQIARKALKESESPR